MKKIIFIRHGKAEDQTPEISDFERSLTVKGKVVSRLMAKKLKEKEKSPGIIFSSPAFRAIETALIFAGEYNVDPGKIIFHSDLYFRTDEKSFIEILKLADEDVDIITLFGHNPSFTDMTDYFSKESGDVIPKSGIVCISFKVKTWTAIKGDTGTLDYFLNPKKVL